MVLKGQPLVMINKGPITKMPCYVVDLNIVEFDLFDEVIKQ